VVRLKAFALAAALVLAAGSAHALSFSVPDGRVIEDIDISGTTGDFLINGADDQGDDLATEWLFVTADVNAIRLDDGSTIQLAADQVTFSSALKLNDGSVSVSTDFFGNTSITANFSNGVTADFSLIDNVAGETVFSGELGGPIELGLSEFAGPTGVFGAASQGGSFSIIDANPELLGKILSEGNLGLDLGAFRQNGSNASSLSALLDSESPQGFEDWDAQPTGDFNFSGAVVPEPGSSALLLTLAAAAAWGGRRARRG